ncbi:MAG: cytochrome c3 family protein [Spirochaetales bacterium]|nr:cytochrome c3 family protein [Spirochaetales bacterium]
MYISFTGNKIPVLLFALLILFFAGCSAEVGTDSLSTRKTVTYSQTVELGCVDCHSSAISNLRQVMGAGGDFDEESHHVIDYSNRNFEIIIEADCLICHDQSEHMSGTVLLKNKDTSGSIAYDPADPATLENFCLSCHDSDGAVTEGANAMSPFSSSNILGVMPNSAGSKIKSYWTDSNTVHKDSGLTCFGNGDPATGCHGNGGKVNAHSSNARGLLTKNVTFPIPASSPYSSADFELCFSCHDSYPSVTKEVVLGYKTGGNYEQWWAPTPYPTSSIQSRFRDRYIGNSANYPAYWGGINQSYNDTIWGDAYTPLHNYHMSPTDGWMQNAWEYRGDPGEKGRASCITCHNVHGTSGTVRSVYSQFGITSSAGLGSDTYGTLTDTSGLKDYPVNCAIECHSMSGPTSYWNTPSGE